MYRVTLEERLEVFEYLKNSQGSNFKDLLTGTKIESKKLNIILKAFMKGNMVAARRGEDTQYYLSRAGRGKF